MRLAEFIRENREPILHEWEEFARSCAPASGGMDLTALRDHANAMLTFIADDLESPQTAGQGAEKSKGRDPRAHDVATAAEEHGVGRAESGFTIEQLVAEYRALRASVICLWLKDRTELPPEHVADLTRFSEAIDQVLAESIETFNRAIEEAKDVFIGILGHDLRTPIGAIITSSQFIVQSGELSETHQRLAQRIVTSAERTMGMVGDLLDFTRGRLGGGIPISPATTDLSSVLRDLIDEVVAAYPGTEVAVEIHGDAQGEWDRARVSQALGNILMNAVQHGETGAPVSVELRGRPLDVAIRVGNRGAAIPSNELAAIFRPMAMVKRSQPAFRSNSSTDSLGLGLYIADRIIAAHGGRIDVESSVSAGTAFTVVLPRDGNGGGSS